MLDKLLIEFIQIYILLWNEMCVIEKMVKCECWKARRELKKHNSKKKENGRKLYYVLVPKKIILCSLVNK